MAFRKTRRTNISLMFSDSEAVESVFSSWGHTSLRTSPGPYAPPLSLGRSSSASAATVPSGDRLSLHSGGHPDAMHHSVVCQLPQEGAHSSTELIGTQLPAVEASASSVTQPTLPPSSSNYSLLTCDTGRYMHAPQD